MVRSGTKLPAILMNYICRSHADLILVTFTSQSAFFQKRSESRSEPTLYINMIGRIRASLSLCPPTAPGNNILWWICNEQADMTGMCSDDTKFSLIPSLRLTLPPHHIHHDLDTPDGNDERESSPLIRGLETYTDRRRKLLGRCKVSFGCLIVDGGACATWFLIIFVDLNRLQDLFGFQSWAWWRWLNSSHSWCDTYTWSSSSPHLTRTVLGAYSRARSYHTCPFTVHHVVDLGHIHCSSSHLDRLFLVSLYPATCQIRAYLRFLKTDPSLYYMTAILSSCQWELCC